MQLQLDRQQLRMRLPKKTRLVHRLVNKMNRLESTVSVLNIQSENLMSAESRISDVDVATEIAAMTRNQVLAQAKAQGCSGLRNNLK